LTTFSATEKLNIIKFLLYLGLKHKAETQEKNHFKGHQ
jgi:hypothetical protein